VGELVRCTRGATGKDAFKIREAFGGIAGSIGQLLNFRIGYGGREVNYRGDPSVGSVALGETFRETPAARLARGGPGSDGRATPGGGSEEHRGGPPGDPAGFFVKAAAILLVVAALGSLLL
jgi:hypothetical protein